MKKNIFFLFYALFAVHVSCFAISTETWEKPERVSDEIWEKLKPYLMPKDHPLCKRLDRLFSSRRVLANQASILAAGFENATPGPYSGVIVSEHKTMSRYVFKFFSDEQHGRVGWLNCFNRASGARSVQARIDQYQYQNFFVVPKKWIYPLPNAPAAVSGANEQHFVLVAEKLKLAYGDKNRFAWKYRLTKNHINALYNLYKAEGLIDCVRLFNARFTADNRIALIDLEHHHQWPVGFYHLYKHLSPGCRRHLQWLVDTNQ